MCDSNFTLVCVTFWGEWWLLLLLNEMCRRIRLSLTPYEYLQVHLWVPVNIYESTWARPYKGAGKCVCVCEYGVFIRVCEKERGEINPMLSSIPGYEFTASVWASHCLNNNLINPVFISFTELGREAGSERGRTGNSGRKYQAAREGRERRKKWGVWWGLKN